MSWIGLFGAATTTTTTKHPHWKQSEKHKPK